MCWVLVLVGLVAALGPLHDSLGSYAGVTGARPPVFQSSRWTLDHLIELALMVGVIPLVLTAALLCSRSAWRDARVGAFLAVSAACLVVLLPFTGWFAAGVAGRIIERYVAYIVPLLLVGGVVGARYAHWRAAAGVTALLALGALAIHDPVASAGPLAGGSELPSFFIAGMDVLGWDTPKDGGLGGIAALIAAMGSLTALGLYLRDSPRTVQTAGRAWPAGRIAGIAGIAVVAAWLVNSGRHAWTDLHETARNYSETYFAGSAPDGADRVSSADKTLVGLALPEVAVLWVEFFNKHIKDVVPAPGGAVGAGYGPACTFRLDDDGSFARGTRCDHGRTTFVVASYPTDSFPTLRDGGPATRLSIPRANLIEGTPRFLAVRQPLCEAGACRPATIETWTERPAVLRLRFNGGQAGHRIATTISGEQPRISAIPANVPTTVDVRVKSGRQTITVQPDWEYAGPDTPTAAGIDVTEAGRPPRRLN